MEHQQSCSSKMTSSPPLSRHTATRTTPSGATDVSLCEAVVFLEWAMAEGGKVAPLGGHPLIETAIVLLCLGIGGGCGSSCGGVVGSAVLLHRLHQGVHRHWWCALPCALRCTPLWCTRYITVAQAYYCCNTGITVEKRDSCGLSGPYGVPPGPAGNAPGLVSVGDKGGHDKEREGGKGEGKLCGQCRDGGNDRHLNRDAHHDLADVIGMVKMETPWSEQLRVRVFSNYGISCGGSGVLPVVGRPRCSP